MRCKQQIKFRRELQNKMIANGDCVLGIKKILQNSSACVAVYDRPTQHMGPWATCSPQKLFLQTARAFTM